MIARLHQNGRERGILTVIVNGAAPLVSTHGRRVLVELEHLLFHGLLVLQKLVVLLSY